MPRFERLVRSVACVIVCGGVLSAQGQQIAETTQHPWLSAFWNLPIIHTLASLFRATPEPRRLGVAAEIASDGFPQTLPAAKRQGPAAVCSVAPLDPITDPDAQNLEAGVTPSVDISRMKRAAAAALDRFQSNVSAAGGTIILKSAYRPAAYQKHLQNVWHKWMDELRQNDEPGCQDLRTQVEEEFTRHCLIETQPPVAVSDHTRGLAFDAMVDLPGGARLGRRRVTLDLLARLSGLLRPAIVTDPVHFKFVGSPSDRRKRNT